MTVAGFATPAEALDRVAAQRQADPTLRADAEAVAEGLDAVADGSFPAHRFIASFPTGVLAGALATWGPSAPEAGRLAAILREFLEDDGWVLTARGWMEGRALASGQGVILPGPDGSYADERAPLYLVEEVPGEAPWQRQLVVAPPPAGSAAEQKDGRP